MRIDVVGLPASGKSTFASSLSRKLGIKHIHLDRFWFESGGRQGRHDTPNLEEVRAKVRERALIAFRSDSWVSDGVYLHIQDVIAPRADKIIFLDIPLWKRLLNHAQRVFLEKKRHKELSFIDEMTFFKEIIKREFSSGPKLRQFVKENQNKVIILSNRKAMRHFIQETARHSPESSSVSP
jgi:adenylate kinase family enzyme